jgi:cell division protein FtsW (lipid II flippase)
MKTFRWSTTMLILGLIAALISALVVFQLTGPVASLILFVSLLLLVIVAIFGRQGV